MKTYYIDQEALLKNKNYKLILHDIRNRGFLEYNLIGNRIVRTYTPEVHLLITEKIKLEDGKTVDGEKVFLPEFLEGYEAGAIDFKESYLKDPVRDANIILNKRKDWAFVRTMYPYIITPGDKKNSTYKYGYYSACEHEFQDLQAIYPGIFEIKEEVKEIKQLADLFKEESYKRLVPQFISEYRKEAFAVIVRVFIALEQEGAVHSWNYSSAKGTGNKRVINQKDLVTLIIKEFNIELGSKSGLSETINLYPNMPEKELIKYRNLFK